MCIQAFPSWSIAPTYLPNIYTGGFVSYKGKDIQYLCPTECGWPVLAWKKMEVVGWAEEDLGRMCKEGHGIVWSVVRMSNIQVCVEGVDMKQIFKPILARMKWIFSK